MNKYVEKGMWAYEKLKFAVQDNEFAGAWQIDLLLPFDWTQRGEVSTEHPTVKTFLELQESKLPSLSLKSIRNEIDPRGVKLCILFVERGGGEIRRIVNGGEI